MRIDFHVRGWLLLGLLSECLFIANAKPLLYINTSQGQIVRISAAFILAYSVYAVCLYVFFERLLYFCTKLYSVGVCVNANDEAPAPDGSANTGYPTKPPHVNIYTKELLTLNRQLICLSKETSALRQETNELPDSIIRNTHTRHPR